MFRVPAVRLACGRRCLSLLPFLPTALLLRSVCVHLTFFSSGERIPTPSLRRAAQRHYLTATMSTSTDTMTGITTIFTPPEDCKTSWTYEAESYNGVTGGLLIQIVNENDFATSCFPDGFEGYGRQPIVQVYSPGVCPSGYATQGESDVGGTTTGICCQRCVPT